MSLSFARVSASSRASTCCRRRRERTRAHVSLVARASGADDPWLRDMIDAALEAERRAGAARDAAGASATEASASAGGVVEEEEEDEAYEGEGSRGDLSEERESEILGTSPRARSEDDGIGSSAPSGPPAVILIGFRAEEWPRVRVILDELGGYDVPVIPARSEHAWMTLEEVAHSPEPDWESPRVVSTARGGEYGSQRALAFSGLDLGEIAVVVSAVEAQGLPRLPVIIATDENLVKPLGESLAKTFKSHRVDSRRRKKIDRTDDSFDRPRAVQLSEDETVIPEVVSTPISMLGSNIDRGCPVVAEASAPAALSEPSPSLITKSQLRELAARRGLAYQDLLDSATAAGIKLPD